MQARFVPAHEVAFQVLSGLDVEVNDFFYWPLLRVMEEIEARIRARNREKEMMVGMLRVGVPDYPERALREAVANALIHRDYLRLGAVHIQWYPHQIEISNPVCVRQRGFEPLQQEQMVLQYVEKHGRITRREAANLCRIGSYQANRLLTRLVKDGRLDKYGEGKGTWYERAQKMIVRTELMRVV